MTTSRDPSGETVPEVFDRIADTARRIHQEGSALPEESFISAEPVAVERASADDRVAATVVDGRVEALRVDSAALEEHGWPVIERTLVGLINDALAAAQAENLAQLTEINKSFGDLVNGLGGLQADLHAAYLGDMKELG